MRLLIAALGTGLLAFAIWLYGNARYHEGLSKERSAHAADLARINAKGEQQNRESRDKEEQWAKDFQALENRYAQLEADSRKSIHDRDVRIGGLVQNAASCRVRELSQAPSDPRRIAEATRITQRAGEIGAAIGAVGSAAQRDARRLALCVDTLRAERQ